MLTLQAEWTPVLSFGVYSYASDMMFKFAPGLADSYLSSAVLEHRKLSSMDSLLLQLVQDLQVDPK